MDKTQLIPKYNYDVSIWLQEFHKQSFVAFILKKVMLVRRSTVDFRSCSRALLLAGKLFCRRIQRRDAVKRFMSVDRDKSLAFKSRVWIHRYKNEDRLEKKKVGENLIHHVLARIKKKKKRLTRYMERSILRELCSWSRSLTKRSLWKRQEPRSFTHRS